MELSSLLEILPSFIDKLILQKEILSDEYGVEKYSSLYIGGGTPSLIPVKSLDRYSTLIDSVMGEKTIEVNPESVTADLLKKYDDLGLNRISMGIQSFKDLLLKKMGRLADEKINLRALELIEKYWNHDWSIDLIFGYPGQTNMTQIKDIATLLKVRPPHFSLYTLTIEKGTGLEKSLHQNDCQLPDQDEMDECWFDSLALINENGYRRYEISSFGLNDITSRHNINYWNMGRWIGLGPGGGSHMWENQDNPLRFTGKVLKDFMISQGNDFLSAGPFYHSEKIDKLDSLKEILMMGLRMSQGISLSRLNKVTKRDFLTMMAPILPKWKDFLNIGGDRIFLTEKGMDWHSAVVVDIFFQLENLYGCHE